MYGTFIFTQKELAEHDRAVRAEGIRHGEDRLLDLVERQRPANPRNDWTEYAEGMATAVSNVLDGLGRWREHPELFYKHEQAPDDSGVAS